MTNNNTRRGRKEGKHKDGGKRVERKMRGKEKRKQ